MTMSSKLYEILKWIVQIVLPACGALYSALAALWGFPYVEQIVGTISAVTVFLGALMKISSSNYYKALDSDSETTDNSTEALG
jgi:hypothetical protein